MLKRLVLANHSTLGNALAVLNPHGDIELTISLPPRLFEGAASVAALEGTSINQLITRAVQREVDAVSARVFTKTFDEFLVKDAKILRRLGEE